MTLRTRSGLFLAALAVVAAILAGMLSRGVPLQTNVLAMLPATERDPVAEKVVASLSAAIGSRVLIVFSHADEARTKAAAERFAAAASGAGGPPGLPAAPPQTAIAAEPGTEILRTGTVFFAASARAAAMHDMDRIALGSIVGITLVMFAAFRSLRPIVLGLLSAGAGILAATLALLLVDGELHLVTLAFGASLIGEAIDYAILFCAAHLAAGNRWTPQMGVAQVRPALTVAVATSLLAYALLGLLPFPGVSQVARFALVGLAVAYLSVQWLLPGLLTRPSRRDPLAATSWAARLLERWSGVLRGKRAVAIAALALAACIPGWMALQPNDDVRLLVPRQPELALQDATIRATTGLDARRRFFPVRATSEE